jgi:cytochrome c peroxidase
VRGPWLIMMSTVAVGCSALDEPALVVAQQLAVAALPAVVPYPGSKPTAAEVELGRSLFWDPILSGEQDVACATCHHPRFAYADGIALSIGVGGSGLGTARKAGAIAHRTPRNSMTVLNVAWNGVGATSAAPSPADAPMFWDNRVNSLEVQALKPIENQDEMRGDNIREEEIVPLVLSRLAATPGYVSRFEEVFGPGPITGEMLGRAIASFERTLVSRSSFDRFMAGDDGAISHAAKRGLVAFVNSGCTRCHSGPMFSDFELHRIGVPEVAGAKHDDGDGMDRFRTPSLRAVTKTGPFMHAGQLRTLGDALDFYSRVDKSLDPDLADVVPVGFDDIVTFLETISDGDFDASIPITVPSGLPPGGNIAAVPSN